MDRRTFLKLYLIGGAAIAISPLIKPILDYAGFFYGEIVETSRNYWVANNTNGLGGFPKYKIANYYSDVAPVFNKGCPVYFFAYPLQNEPCFLVDLKVLTGKEVPEIQNPYYGKYPGPLGSLKTIKGVGPSNSIYAFSAVCVHLGCQLPAQVKSNNPDLPGLNPSTSILHCPCHGSMFKLDEGGVVVGGPANRPLPMVILDYDPSTGDIFAVGDNAPYFSAGLPRNTPSDNLLYDPRYSYSVPSNPACQG